MSVGPKGVPYITTHDARTIRYPDPLIKVNDTVQVDITTGKIKDFIKFDSGMFFFFFNTLGETFFICWITLHQVKFFRLVIGNKKIKKIKKRTW